MSAVVKKFNVDFFFFFLGWRDFILQFFFFFLTFILFIYFFLEIMFQFTFIHKQKLRLLLLESEVKIIFISLCITSYIIPCGLKYFQINFKN